jgi:hypothetical protein
MTTTLSIWVAALALFLTHQLEEIVYSIAAWNNQHPRPSWRRWTAWLHRSPMASPAVRVRIRTVAGQCLGLVLVGAIVSRTLLATKIAVALLMAGLAVAYLMHITVSVLTRSAMPGLTTSILPGLPGAVLLLAYAWSR